MTMASKGQSRTLRRDNIVAGLWGLAESTVFFVVPDVCLSYLALRSLRGALIACVFATLGALGGGVLMYAWGATDPQAATVFLDRVPAVSAGMIDGVEQALAGKGPGAVVIGSFIGTPYKIYAVKAAVLELSLPLFLLLSIPARLSRFVLAVVVTRTVVSTLGAKWTRRRRFWTLVTFWVLFYAAFLGLMPS